MGSNKSTMEKFETLTGIAAPLDRPNVDTDQIIPKQFLKRIERTGFGEFLFYDWKYEDDGKTLNPNFELNSPQYDGAAILIAGKRGRSECQNCIGEQQDPDGGHCVYPHWAAREI